LLSCGEPALGGSADALQVGGALDGALCHEHDFREFLEDQRATICGDVIGQSAE
jgi:hypothetical protein